MIETKWINMLTTFYQGKIEHTCLVIETILWYNYNGKNCNKFNKLSCIGLCFLF